VLSRTALGFVALFALGWGALGWGALGCGARAYGGRTRQPDTRAMVRLERQAQREMHCGSPLRVVPLGTSAFQVDGCGQLREYAYVCPGRRCAFEPIIPAVVRASQDLQCAPQQLVAAADSATHRAFFGCMRGAAYHLLCLDHGCTWSRTPEAVTITSPEAAAPTLAPSPVDPVLADVAIPPPPGAAAPVPAPPPAPPPAPAPAPASTDSVVIPPPPS
jgi:hypothetical protein